MIFCSPSNVNQEKLEDMGLIPQSETGAHFCQRTWTRLRGEPVKQRPFTPLQGLLMLLCKTVLVLLRNHYFVFGHFLTRRSWTTWRTARILECQFLTKQLYLPTLYKRKVGMWSASRSLKLVAGRIEESRLLQEDNYRALLSSA